jgi:large repetitive protein
MSCPDRLAVLGRRSSFLGGLLAAAWLAVPAPAAHADAVSCGRVITTSTTVTNNLSNCAGDGLVIGAGGITLDLNGHTIEGTGLGVGVRNNGHDGVTIRNGTITKFDYGIVLGPGTLGNAVTGILLVETEWSAIHLVNADGNQIRHSRAFAFSDVGVHLMNGSSGNTVANNTVGSGNGESIVLEGGSNQNRLQGNVVNASSDTSVRVDASAGNALVANRITGGSDMAISMTRAPASVVQSNAVTGVGDAAIVLSESARNVVRFNQLGRSADAGIILSTVADSLVKANTMSHAGDAGIVLMATSTGNRVIDNQAHHSSDAGIFIGDSVSNVVRGNTLLNNAAGIELSGGRLNRLEFNAVNANLGIGVEISESAHNTVFGNTINNNNGGGILLEPVEDVASYNRITANAAIWNRGNGMSIYDLGSIVTGNLAAHNLGWGIYAVQGNVEASVRTLRVADGGGNGARGNAEAAQCHLIACSNGSGWRAPVRPPEPLDPLELGLLTQSAAPPRRPTPSAADPQSVLGQPVQQVQPVRAGRLALVRCKRRSAARGRAKVICRAHYRAKPTSRRLTGRLIRDGKSHARGTRRVQAGRRGSLAMRARRRPKAGRYTLALTFRDARGSRIVVRKAVRVR